MSLSRVESILGKSIELIECRELLEVAKVISESPYVEIKGYHGSAGERWEQIRETILKTLVGFLNSVQGEGLLVLGYDEKRREPTPMPLSAFDLDEGAGKRGLESKLRETIVSGIKVIPLIDPTVLPLFKVKIWEAGECEIGGEGYIVLLHAVRRYDALYYYNAHQAYIREGSRTRRLSIDEILRTADVKSRPILMLLVTRPIQQPNGGIRAKFVLKNIGSRPAFNVVALIRLPKTPYSLDVDPSYVIEDCHDHLKVQYSAMQPLSIPVFPDVETQTSLWVLARSTTKELKLRIMSRIFTETTETYELLDLDYVDGVCREHAKLEVYDYRTWSPIYKNSISLKCPTAFEK